MAMAGIRAIIAEEINRLQDAGPTTDELERGRAQAEAAFVFRVQSLGGSGGRADQLNAYNVYQGEPDGFDADLARYLDATPESVRATFAKYIDPEKATELRVIPTTHN